ncbi:MAG: hypothetical protein LBE13_05165 [Bacteroidales bacterium]|jgi:hypothetical protein|nr:hypothetical protein [Bacteroidales bacterium]
MCKYVQKSGKYIWAITSVLMLMFLLLFIQNILRIDDLFEITVEEMDTEANKSRVIQLQTLCNTAFLWIALVSSVATFYFTFIFTSMLRCVGPKDLK